MCNYFIALFLFTANKRYILLCSLFVGVVYSKVFFMSAMLKGTLIQIWKSPYMFVFIWKQYPGNLAFLILRILELLVRECCKFLKK